MKDNFANDQISAVCGDGFSKGFRLITFQNADKFITKHYQIQQTDKACSVASLATILSYIEGRVVTQGELLHRVPDTDWLRGLAMDGRGVTLSQLDQISRQALSSFGRQEFRVRCVHVREQSFCVRRQLRDELARLSDTSYLIANFDQGVLTGGESFGHFSPVGHYHSNSKEVLVLDTDSEIDEPHLVRDSVLVRAMATQDLESGDCRGYLVIDRHDG